MPLLTQITGLQGALCRYWSGACSNPPWFGYAFQAIETMFDEARSSCELWMMSGSWFSFEERNDTPGGEESCFQITYVLM